MICKVIYSRKWDRCEVLLNTSHLLRAKNGLRALDPSFRPRSVFVVMFTCCHVYVLSCCQFAPIRDALYLSLIIRSELVISEKKFL